VILEKVDDKNKPNKKVKPYYKAMNVASEYAEPAKAISTNISQKYKKSFDELRKDGVTIMTLIKSIHVRYS
jgi:hypothetical protein